MGRLMSGKRPWLAAVLGAVLTGAGHLYLRRWLRALGWILLATLTADLFVPSGTLAALESFVLTGTGTPPDFAALAPLLMVSFLSVVDAYFMAVLANRQAAIEAQTRCPSCHREVDEELAFCQWCSEPLVEMPVEDDTLDSF